MSNIVNIKLVSGDVKSFDKGTMYIDVIRAFDAKEDVIACKCGGNIVSLGEKVYYDEEIDFVYKNTREGRGIIKSGIKFVFLAAIKRVLGDAVIKFDHSVPSGIYTHIDYTSIVSNDDILRIKDEMDKIVRENLVINKLTIKKQEAIGLYNSLKEFEKANNALNILDSIVTIFELDGNYNYFYSEMPYSTNIINNYDIAYLGNNKLVLVLPDENLLKREYVHNEGIVDSFSYNAKWLSSVGSPYFEDLNLKVGSGKIKKFIKSNEVVYDMSIEKVARDIQSNKDIKFVLIAGPSSSGKTTTTKRLAGYFEALGYSTIKLSTDDYFVDRDKLVPNDKGELDYEHISAIDLELFNKDLKALMNGEVVKPPVYDFITGSKEAGSESVKLMNKTIVLIEGLHSLNEDLSKVIDKKNKYKIYLSPFTSMNIDRHNNISSLDLRLIRRIIRDNNFRGYGVATTMHNWNAVRYGEENYIFPFIGEADTIINTALEYELGVLKVYVEPLLLSVNISSPYYPEARRLLCFLKQFFPITSEYVNRNSILREFIGGLDD